MLANLLMVVAVVVTHLSLMPQVRSPLTSPQLARPSPRQAQEGTAGAVERQGQATPSAPAQGYRSQAAAAGTPHSLGPATPGLAITLASPGANLMHMRWGGNTAAGTPSGTPGAGAAQAGRSTGMRAAMATPRSVRRRQPVASPLPQGQQGAYAAPPRTPGSGLQHGQASPTPVASGRRGVMPGRSGGGAR